MKKNNFVDEKKKKLIVEKKLEKYAEEKSEKIDKKINEKIKNKFTFIFGIALVIIGIASIFFKIEYSTIVGISIASFLFLIINEFFGEDSYLNLIPLCLLFCFLIFSNTIIDTKFYKLLLNQNFSNCILIVSFGLIFIFSYWNKYLDLMKKEIEALNNHNIILEHIISDKEDYNNILLIIISIRKKLVKLKIKAFENELNFLEEYFREKDFLNQIKNAILSNNSENIDLLKEIECVCKKKLPSLDKKSIKNMSLEYVKIKDKKIQNK